MAETTHKKVAERLSQLMGQLSIQALHRDMYMDMLEPLCNEPGQEAILFALRASAGASFDLRLELDELSKTMNESRN